MSGLSSTGFDRKRLVDVKADIESRLKLVFGENIDLSPQSTFGQFVGIESEAQSDQWQQMENVYNSQYPSTAQGVQLSNVVMLNGITRQEAQKSTVTETFTGLSGTVLPVGTQMKTSDTNSIFETLVEDTIGGGGTVDIAMQSVEYGEVEAAIGTLTVIGTPIYGLTGGSNAAAASLGREVETDAELRVRRKASTGAPGSNLVDSLYGQLSNVDGVTDVIVISNGLDIASIDGIPAHQFSATIIGGADADIGGVIWANSPQGIMSYGNSSVIHTDAQGFPQEVFFNRPVEVDVYFAINIATDSTFPITGVAEIKQAIVDYGEANFRSGADVIRTEFYTAVNATQGVIDMEIFIGLSASPTAKANINITMSEISAYDTANVEVLYV